MEKIILMAGIITTLVNLYLMIKVGKVCEELNLKQGWQTFSARHLVHIENAAIFGGVVGLVLVVLGVKYA